VFPPEWTQALFEAQPAARRNVAAPRFGAASPE
jgi:hypothetical protein